ncbi:MAG: hypothetical protein DRQ89_12405 [Epsilonproteobacteria bacterium]|nr:MAG: hypothetical protein DRQ89_12405 [Campylobacterota bacterium]
MTAYLIGAALFSLFWIKVLIVDEKLKGWELLGGAVTTLWIVAVWPGVAAAVLLLTIRKKLWKV